MKFVEPKVFLVGESKIIPEGLNAYLEHIGVPEWTSDAPTDNEKLIELMGRLCYKSFRERLNPNVVKIRKHNGEYLENILRVKHGSVIEHGETHWIFADVSRVFTHELVRHRPGTAISQESLRFVRIEDIRFWPPTVIRENPEAVRIFEEAIKYLEACQRELAKLYKLDEPGVAFHLKKAVTSAMRRILPEGVATNIGWSANIRTLRWVIEARTAPEAEEEIRLVFGKVAEIARNRWPHLFSDFESVLVEGLPHWKPKFSKV
jgi:thymidylate synthase (FAD)